MHSYIIHTRHRKIKWNLSALLILFLLVSSSCGLFAQSYSFNKILTQEGEANLSVRQILQDENGFLWLATFNGLYRYQGADYITEYSFKRDLKINYDVTSLIQDHEDNLWIGTNNGLSKFNPKTENLITYLYDELDSFSIGDNKIRSLDVDENGNIWIGTREGGLFLYLPEKEIFKSINFAKDKFVNPSYVKSLLVASDGKIWVGTFQNGVYCLVVSGEQVKVICNFRVEDEEHPLTHNFVQTLFEDSDGKIVAGTRNGINVFDPETKTMKSFRTNPDYSKDMLTNSFFSVIRKKNGKLWIGSTGGLIVCDKFSDLESGDFELMVHDRRNINSISHSQIMDLLEDKSGTVWIGTENGLNNYDPYQNQFQPINSGAISELLEQSATAFCSYKDGMLILTLSHGLIFKNKEGSEFFPVNNNFALDSDKLYSLLVDSKDNVWLGSYNGYLIRIDAQTKNIKHFKHSVQNIPIYALEEAGNGDILVGTDGKGLKYFNPETEKFTTHSTLSGGVSINDILIDKSNSVWVASQLGIFKRSATGHNFEYYLPDNNRGMDTPNFFNAVAESRNGEIYVGGRNGLYTYKNNAFQPLEFEGTERVWVTNMLFNVRTYWTNFSINLRDTFYI